MASRAIAMNKFVDIASTTLPTGASDRNLGLRLITKSGGIGGTKLPEDTVVECDALSDVLGYFESTSDEYKIASKYFSFVSLTATMPDKISFWRIKDKNSGVSGASPEYDSIATTLDKMVATSDNFATFFLVHRDRDTTTGFTENDFKDAATWVAAQKQKFRYVLPVQLSSIATSTDGGFSWQKTTGADEYIKQFKQKGVTAVVDDNFVTTDNKTTYPEWLTCALLAATKYSRANSTIIQEFKALDSANMNVTCNTDSLYTILTNLNINFFGQTQKAGKQIAFYMEGFNLDGDDTSCYDNDIWLKDRVTSEVFNRFVKCNKVPAGSVGRAMIKTAIDGVISEALNNLSVQPEKTISDADKAAIIQNTGATDAPAMIYSDGYYLVVQDGTTENPGAAKRRVVDYILYYSTGEGIRKVTGSHVLV